MPMEPNMPPLHPKIAALIDELDLRVIDAIKWNVFICRRKSDADGQNFVLKIGDDDRKAKSVRHETRVYLEVLQRFDPDSFERLAFPDHVANGEFNGVPWLMTLQVEGQQLERQWSEVSRKTAQLGGAAIDAGTAPSAVDLLRDLRSVEIAGVPDFVPRFDFKAWMGEFPKRAAALASRGFVEKKTIDAAVALMRTVRPEQFGATMFSNGDFYPRNFVIMADGRIALVDWVAEVDVWEFTAMHAWAMMWGNPRWQIGFVRALKRHFPLEPEAMRLGLLVKTFDQAARWSDEAEETIGFARTQMLTYFRESLDLDYVRGVYNDQD